MTVIFEIAWTSLAGWMMTHACMSHFHVLSTHFPYYTLIITHQTSNIISTITIVFVESPYDGDSYGSGGSNIVLSKLLPGF
jgi:hypothetical protein